MNLADVFPDPRLRDRRHMTWETLPNRTGLCKYMYPQKSDATDLKLEFI
jgi:hypothetical protein